MQAAVAVACSPRMDAAEKTGTASKEVEGPGAGMSVCPPARHICVVVVVVVDVLLLLLLLLL